MTLETIITNDDLELEGHFATMSWPYFCVHQTQLKKVGASAEKFEKVRHLSCSVTPKVGALYIIN